MPHITKTETGSKFATPLIEIDMTPELRHLSSNSDKIYRPMPKHMLMMTVGPKLKMGVAYNSCIT